MFKFFKRIGNKWWLVVLLLLAIVINVMMDCLLPIELGEVIKHLSNPGTIDPTIPPEGITSSMLMTTILFDALKMILIALLSGASNILTCRIASKLTAHIISQVRYEFYTKVQSFSLEEMNRFSVSSLVTRSTNDLTFVENTFNLFFRFILYGPLIAVLAMVALTAINVWQLTLAIAVALVIMMIFMIILIKVTIPKYQAIQARLDKVNLVTRENLEGLRVVRAYNAEEYQENKFRGVNNVLMKTEKFSNKSLGLLMPGIQLVVGLLNVGIYLISSTLIVDTKNMAYQDLSVVIQYAALILVGFVLLTYVIIQLPRCIVCAKRVNEVIDTEPSIKGAETSVESSEEGTIEFKDVSFAYPGAEKPVLEHISFKVKKGETIAFIGATGSGKTTLINLLPRFFDCTSGEVLVDGVNVKEYPLEQLNKKFGYVPQKGYLFHASLVKNITVGKPDASASNIERALNIAQASEFVEKLPGGLDYEISQGGKNVSGGQRQRLCIARAIIMEPEIFIFDDSFSALDYRTDRVLRGEIKKQCVGTTNVIVAQRVGTIMDADQIVVLDEGKIAGIGTHKELLQSCSVYKEIALSQLSEEELKNGAK
ncbi:MAG: ABC transporter ATP-binding protein/permease [Bacilli bacterium]|nr:ABC transporter ATP-binding protein/permease [Bacilli bacterium]